MPEFHAHEPAQQAWKRQVLACEIEFEEIDADPFRDRYGPNSVVPASIRLRLVASFKISKRATYGLFQTIEIIASNPPDHACVNAVISVTKYISETADRLPRLLGRQRFGIALQSASGFADNQQAWSTA
jgi:hypothetical protein